MSSQGDASSDEDDVFEESVLDAFSMSGVLERWTGDKKQKFFWYMLLGGTLFEYRTVKHKDPKESFNLKGCEVVEVAKPITTAFEVRKDGKVLLCLLPQSEETRREWVEELRKALGKDSVPPPKRVKMSKGTLKMRMKKSLAGRMAVSSPGKFMAKSSVPEEVQKLINSLKVIMKTYLGEEAATSVEDNIIKIYVKCFCLEEDGQLTMADFNTIDQPIRRAFTAISKLRDSTVVRRGVTKEMVDTQIAEIREHFRETETKLLALLTPLLSPQSVSKVSAIFKHLNSGTFLRKAIVAPVPGEPEEKGFLDDEIDALCSAMDKYLSVHYYQDE